VLEAKAFIAPLVTGLLLGLVAMLWGIFFTRFGIRRARQDAEEIRAESRRTAESEGKEILVQAQEKAFALEQEADRRDRELEEREAQFETRARKLERDVAEHARDRKQLKRRQAEFEQTEVRAREAETKALRNEKAARENLDRIAGLTAAEARSELIANIEAEAQKEGARLARKIEDEACQNAEREARNLIVQASQRLNLRDVMESTVSFIELPSDEMKGRIIGKEGRNIRALEMATGIDLIVDDTPRSIWVSSFDPIRREIAHVAIDRLLQDGRIHPARIEEVVAQVTEEIESIVEEKGTEAAFSLGISDLNVKLARLVGKMRYHTSHGQNLLQHAVETAQIAGYMVEELGGDAAVARHAGLLHEIGQVSENGSGNAIFAAAELVAKYHESEEVVHAIRSLHQDVQANSMEAHLLNVANRLSENRPGARKENLAVFVERLRRLESIATRFPGVKRAFAVKAGKELRVIIDAGETRDDTAYAMCKQIARAVEKELSYPGQVKVSVVRETRAVRFAV
jgi:ribonuclease Y